MSIPLQIHFLFPQDMINLELFPNKKIPLFKQQSFYAENPTTKLMHLNHNPSAELHDEAIQDADDQGSHQLVKSVRNYDQVALKELYNSDPCSTTHWAAMCPSADPPNFPLILITSGGSTW